MLSFLSVLALARVGMLLHRMSMTLTRLAPLPMEVATLKEQMEYLTQVPGSSASCTVDGSPKDGTGTMASIANQLNCVDAKLLELGRTAQALQLEVKQGALQSQLDELQAMVQASQQHLLSLDSPLKHSAGKIEELHEQFKRGHMVDIMKMLASKVEGSELEAVNQNLQQVLLDIVKKLASKAETSELSEVSRLEKQALTEKIVKVETTGDKIQDLCKTLSNEIHVCKTVVAQKIDALQKDMTSHMGWSTQNLRPLFPCVPMIKQMESQLRDAIDYLSRNFKAVEQVHTMGEQTTEGINLLRESLSNQSEIYDNQEQRIGRVESIASGTLDVLNETQDQVTAIARDHAALLQQVLERLPKLPIRKPPTPETTSQMPGQSSSSTSPDGPPTSAVPTVPTQPMPQMHPTQQAPAPTIHMNQQPSAFELRLNDHMPVQLNPRRPAPQIFMMSEPQSSTPVLREVTQQDVLRAFFPQS
ncbi:unnamed protein product [Symbiodinium sp. CCMP2592]|nr:unnamed protein product [Symbiodinium sp. CCMP2592]